MLNMNKKFKVGQLVMLHVPDVDRGPLDPNNLLCYILEIKNQSFRLGSKAGELNTLYACNCIEPSTGLHFDFKIEDIAKMDKKGVSTGSRAIVSVRKAVAALSLGGGRRYVRCACY